jgi:DNA-binding response OmpR family regulator
MEVLPDLILLDVTMPCMSGHEFLRRFRRLERRFAPDESSILAETPVIFVTGRGQLHQRVDGLDAGAIDYVTKPFDADELRARVRRALRETRRHSQVRTACQIDRLSHESAIDAAQLALAACGQALAELELDDGDTTDRACDALERIKQNMKVTASWIKCVVHELEGEATA